MDLRTYQRNNAVTLMAADSYGGRDLLINGQPVRGQLLLIIDQGAGVLTVVNQQQWTLSVPYLSWLSLGVQFPQAQSQVEVGGAGLPDGFAAGAYNVAEVVGLDPTVTVTLTRNF